MIQTRTAGLTVTAEALNPSIFSQVWLVQEGLVGSAAFTGQTLVSRELAQHSFGGVQFLALPDRLQLRFKLDDIESARQALSIADGIAGRLPHTPFRAVGMTFEFMLPSSPNFEQLLSPWAAAHISSMWSKDSVRFGTILEGRVDDGELMLEMRPWSEETVDKLALRFSFHHELVATEREPRTAELRRSIGAWPSRKDTCLRVAGVVQGALEQAK
jgi:hypothetical protein